MSQQTITGSNAFDRVLSRLREPHDVASGIQKLLPGDLVEKTQPVSAIAPHTDPTSA